jgi:hypothetical protein
MSIVRIGLDLDRNRLAFVRVTIAEFGGGGMNYHSVFGVAGPSLAQYSREIGELLEIEMTERKNDTFGTYYLGQMDGLQVKVVEQPNLRGEPVEPEHQDFTIIIYVDGMSRLDVLDGYPIRTSKIVRLSD